MSMSKSKPKSRPRKPHPKPASKKPAKPAASPSFLDEAAIERLPYAMQVPPGHLRNYHPRFADWGYAGFYDHDRPDGGIIVRENLKPDAPRGEPGRIVATILVDPAFSQESAARIAI